MNQPLPAAIDWREGPPLPTRRPRTLPELIAAARAANPRGALIVDGDRVAGWPDLERASARVAAALADELPLGERLAIVAPNGLPHLVAELAAWRLGAVACPVFAGCGRARLRAMLALAAPRVAYIADPALAEVAPAHCRVLGAGELARLAAAPSGDVERAVAADAPCLMQFTSGSTGAPRAVELTHDNLCSQQAAFALLWPEIGPGDRLAAFLPWHHSFGGLAERLWSLARGATLTVVPGGGRDRHALVDTVRAVRPTVFMSVPKGHRIALDADAFDRAALRWAFTAGAPLEADVLAWYESRGVPLYEGWGLTETSPSAVITPPGARRVLGVVGQPIAGVAVGVRADGHVLVRGPNVMRGYFGDPEASARCRVGAAIDSGDFGAWTDDGLRLIGRADHQLKLPNGEKVMAGDVEAALGREAAVRHAVVAIVDGELTALLEAAPGRDVRELRRAIDAANAAQAVPYLRVARAFAIAAPLSVEAGGLTPSLKVARGAVLAAFAAWRSSGGDGFVAL